MAATATTRTASPTSRPWRSATMSRPSATRWPTVTATATARPCRSPCISIRRRSPRLPMCRGGRGRPGDQRQCADQRPVRRRRPAARDDHRQPDRLARRHPGDGGGWQLQLRPAQHPQHRDPGARRPCRDLQLLGGRRSRRQRQLDPVDHRAYRSGGGHRGCRCAEAAEDDPAISGNVLTNDLSGGDDPLHVTTTGNLTGSLGGTLVMAADGSYSYDPHSIPNIETLALGDHVETFSYSVADGHGDSDSSTLSITVHIDPEAVTAVADVAEATEDDPAISGNVLTNDLSGGDDPLHVTTTGNLTGSLGGTLVMAADGSYSYDPHSIPNIETLALGDHVETFSYSVADGHGDSDSSTLSITVHIDPEAVTAVPDVAEATEDDPAISGNVLTNDLSGGDDPLHVTTTGNLTGSLGGTLVMAADG